MKVGYGKFTRSWNSERGSASTVGGDVDVWRLLQRIARKRPQHEYIMIGKHQGGLSEFPSNVTTIWDSRMDAVKLTETTVTREVYEAFIRQWREATDDTRVDAFIGWIGQVGNANSPIPMIGTDWSDNKIANPYTMNVRYTAPLCDYLNRQGVEPILLTPDPRNWWRPRELWRPFTRPILGQYDMEKDTKHEQYGMRGESWQEGAPWEQSVIVARARYVYAGVEYTALDEPHEIAFNADWDRPTHLGIISNENKKEVHDTVSRLVQLKEWVLRAYPQTQIIGTWSDESKADIMKSIVGREGAPPIEPVAQTEMLKTMQQFRATITFPASGSGWVTAKWAEAAAVGTLCFIHPGYDDQDHIFRYADKMKYRQLKRFVRVYTPKQFHEGLRKIADDAGLWRDLVTMQRELFEENFQRWDGGAKHVLERLDQRAAELGE